MNSKYFWILISWKAKQRYFKFYSYQIKRRNFPIFLFKMFLFNSSEIVFTVILLLLPFVITSGTWEWEWWYCCSLINWSMGVGKWGCLKPCQVFRGWSRQTTDRSHGWHDTRISRRTLVIIGWEMWDRGRWIGRLKSVDQVTESVMTRFHVDKNKTIFFVESINLKMTS